MGDQFLPCLESLKHTFSSQPIPNPFSAMMNSNPNPTHSLPSSGLNNIHALLGFPPDATTTLFPQLPQSSPNFAGLFNNTLLPSPVEHVASNDEHPVNKKRKAVESPANSSPQGSDNGIGRKKGSGRGKKMKVDEKDEKPREVVHVRAKRGQATDSHSLAERVRREKINERLRCLQDIVPGCYKTMGMAVMLDEIINYVQSLQNQVEFLSMKLTAASTFYDFNFEADAMEALQLQRAKAVEALKIQNGEIPGINPATFAPLGLDF